MFALRVFGWFCLGSGMSIGVLYSMKHPIPDWAFLLVAFVFFILSLLLEFLGDSIRKLNEESYRNYRITTEGGE